MDDEIPWLPCDQWRSKAFGPSSGGFKFEASWLGEEKCGEVVGESWKKAMNGQQRSAYDALKVVAGDLLDWSQNILGDLEKRIKKSKKIWRSVGGGSLVRIRW